MLQEFLQELDILNLPLSEYVIIGSAVLAIRNIRPCKDLDVLVSDKLWDQLSQKFPIATVNGFEKIEISENIEILGSNSFPLPTGNDPSQLENIQQAEIIAGHPYQSTKHFLYYCYKYNSPQKIADAKLLEE